MRKPTPSKGHVAFIGEHEYYVLDGRAYKAPIEANIVDGYRLGEFVTAQPFMDFALRMARLVAGEPEGI